MSSSSRMCIWSQSGTRLLQHGNCMLPANRGKVPKEYLQRITGLKVIEECLNGHPRARKDWRAAVNLGVHRDERGVRGMVDLE
jgi:hypothetical protein